MEINLETESQQKIKQYNIDKTNEEIDKYYSKENYKVSLINIDSSFRSKSPKNIYSSAMDYLPKNPITVTENSSFVTINYPNHGLVVNDRIIIQNVEGKSTILSGNIFLFQNFSYCVLKIDHNITTNYVNLLNKIRIEISIVDNATFSNTLFYDNIPLNSLLGIFDIKLPSIVNVKNTIPSAVLNYFNVTTVEELDPLCLLIELPFNYFSFNNSYYEINDFLKISFFDINGIPINGVNADYPINYMRLQGYHEVYEIVNKNNFIIKTNYKALSDGNGGGSKIQIMKIINTEEGFPDANNYSIRLKKNYNNVVRIELVSSEFPFIDYLIKNNGKNKNNKIYWKHLDDGNYIYSTEINEGNYDGDNLFTTLSKNMNSVERINSTSNNKIYNDFIINYNLYTQEVQFNSFKTEKVPNSLKIDIVTINSIQYFRLTIKHPNNLVDINDEITIANSEDIGIISTNLINKSHTVFEVSKYNNSYSVLLTTVSSTDLGTTLTDNGGGSITIKTKALVSFLFNYPDTIGSVIGFRNTSQLNAITSYKSVVSNFDSYINDTKLNSVGNTISNNNLLLNLTGSNNYYLLYINNFELVNNNSNMLPSFAKILLSGSPGDVLYNTFINYPLEFEFPISSLNELNIKITYGDGSLPDFRNIDHSFTLKITELVSYPRGTGINSKKTNYVQKLKELVN